MSRYSALIFPASVLIIVTISSGCLRAQEEDQESSDNERDAKIIQHMKPMIKSALIEAVKGFLGKPTHNNQVLALNLTNMLILMAIKGIMWSAAHLGGEGYDKYGRKVSEDSFISEMDTMLLMEYLNGSNYGGHYECLYKTICENPNQAESHVNAARFIFNYFHRGENEIASASKPKSEIIRHLEEALVYGRRNEPCALRYPCENHIV